MKFKRLNIHDVILCEPSIFTDERGYFSETFRHDKLSEYLGLPLNFVQDNESKSSYGVLRGLHYQLPPCAQSKLVRVIQGSILDVAVDMRKGSSTFGEHIVVELTAENKKQLFIPRGFAHGFVVLSNEAVVTYKVDSYYSPAWDRGVAFDDDKLGINWRLPSSDLKLSDKDKNHLSFKSSSLFENASKLYE
ncbi:dTDP-4-dehydrorhamnose 3,5-epimerase [bacterium]|nr:dTDP-4-dehydrorhamnose 3,5-epimerase [bacterium]